jgi:uncharacterized repeat protein (TIGR02543 family)
MKKMSKNRYVVLGVVLMFAFFASSFFLSPSKNIENIASASVLSSLTDSIVNFFTGSSNCSSPRPLPEGSNVDIDDTDNTVTVSIPYDGNPSLCFAPEIQTFYSKTIVTPASGEAQDFTNPVTYTVNQDGLVKTYVVTVNVGPKAITFDSQNATVSANPVIKEIVSPETTVGTLPSEPTKDGYTFGGWYTEIGGGGTEFTATTPVTAAITVYAKWISGTVTFDSQGATVPANPTTKTIALPATSVVILPTAPTKTGYTFKGWYTAVNGGGTVFTATTSATADVTVYAKWIEDYIVTFDSQYATVPASSTTKTIVSPATTVGTLPTAPTKTGYTFGGWYTAVSGGGTAFTATTPVTANITVYAKWGVVGPCLGGVADPACWSPVASGLTWGPAGATGIVSTASGAANTAALASLDGSYPAADYCDALTFDGHSDWYLPAKDQLAAGNAALGSAGFPRGIYRSSTESQWSPWYLVVYQGPTTINSFMATEYYKHQAFSVRCLRTQSTADTDTSAGGTGTVADPLQISNWGQLNYVRNNSTERNTLSASYILIANLSSSTPGYAGIGDNWAPIGRSAKEIFTGNFNGNGHTISDLITTQTGGPDVVGLFGYSRGNISNIGLINVKVVGRNYLGGLVGSMLSGTIDSSYTTGSVTGDNGVSSGRNGSIGGLVGNQGGGRITNSYSTANVSGSRNGAIGGLVGYLNAGTVSNSYSAGRVSTITSDVAIGGLVGYVYQGGTLNSFWDTQTSGQATSPSGSVFMGVGVVGTAGKTTAQMKTPATFATWDPNIWNLVMGSYPTLKNRSASLTVILNTSAPTLVEGNTATLTWTQTNATSCTAGGNDLDWAGSSWTGPSLGTSGVPHTWTTRPLSAGTSTYSISCTGSAGEITSAPKTIIVTPSSNSVTFDSQSATVPASPTTKTVTVPATTVVTLPTAPTKTGYTFGGWYTAVNGGGDAFFDTTAVTTADITVYAKWSAFSPCTGGATDPACWSIGTMGKIWGPTGVTTNVWNTTDGVANTVALAGLTGSYPAADYCDNLTENGYSDWYLPAKDQLWTGLTAYKSQYGSDPTWGGFAGYPTFYWSSTEYPTYPGTNAWGVFYNRSSDYTIKDYVNPFGGLKNANYMVRCLRNPAPAPTVTLSTSASTII